MNPSSRPSARRGSHAGPRAGPREPSTRARVRIGISGWVYAPWRGVFYPSGLPQREELFYAARRFRSIEINGTFYRLQQPKHFARWRDQTPDDFVFAVKGPRAGATCSSTSTTT